MPVRVLGLCDDGGAKGGEEVDLKTGLVDDVEDGGGEGGLSVHEAYPCYDCHDFSQ